MHICCRKVVVNVLDGDRFTFAFSLVLAFASSSSSSYASTLALAFELALKFMLKPLGLCSFLLPFKALPKLRVLVVVIVA